MSNLDLDSLLERLAELIACANWDGVHGYSNQSNETRAAKERVIGVVAMLVSAAKKESKA